MNPLLRREIVFSEHASVELFECLVVAGAPATGLLAEPSHKDVRTLQSTLQLLRDMWRRSDSLYVPKTDLEWLHRMECASARCGDNRIPDPISRDPRKVSRYYVYLLFRYCMSTARFAVTCNQRGAPMSRLLRACAWDTEKRVTVFSDVPPAWLETKASTGYPSAPPLPACDVVDGPSVHHVQREPQRRIYPFLDRYGAESSSSLRQPCVSAADYRIQSQRGDAQRVSGRRRRSDDEPSVSKVADGARARGSSRSGTGPYDAARESEEEA